MERFRRRVFAGFLAIIPLLITLWVMSFLLDLLIRLGRPFVLALAAAIRPYADDLAELITTTLFQSALAIAFVIVLLYALGTATNAMVGRRLLRRVDRLMNTVPLARTIYGASRTFIDSFNKESPQGGQRVVLIEFPTPEMRAVGFVTATFHASDTGEELAAVYVPTTPNPTSGYVEIVPTARLVWLDWTTNDAMSFIVSGGAVTPKSLMMNPESSRLRHGLSDGRSPAMP